MKQFHPEHLTALTDWDGARLLRVLDLARRLKRLSKAGRDPQCLVGKSMVLLFQKPSLRTRLSFEIGFSQLGGQTFHTSGAEVGMGVREPVADVARVVSRYADVIVARVFGHDIVEGLSEASDVPVVNALSDATHPCQIFADLLTASERFDSLDGLRVAWVGDANNVAMSWINAARRLPIELTLACPDGYQFDPALLEELDGECAGRIRAVSDPKKAVEGAHVVYADTWYSMGQEEEKAKRRADFAGFTVDQALLEGADESAVFMHCLPAHRGDEVTDEVIEGPRSVVFDQAENRLHGQKAILLSLLQLESAVR